MPSRLDSVACKNEEVSELKLKPRVPDSRPYGLVWWWRLLSSTTVLAAAAVVAAVVAAALRCIV
jgi:hypothetical protein